MPYIEPERRSALNPLSARDPSEPGGLNFQFTMLADHFIEVHGLNYSTLNAIVGALECTKLELYRRIAAPYEDRKITQNGDVYTHG